MSCVLICDDVRYLRTICDDVYYLHEHRSSSLLLVLILKSFSFLIPQDSHPPLTIRPRSCNDPALLLRNPNSNYSEDVSATLWISTSRKRPTLGERYECCPHYQTPCSNFCPVQFYSLRERDANITIVTKGTRSEPNTSIAYLFKSVVSNSTSESVVTYEG